MTTNVLKLLKNYQANVMAVKVLANRIAEMTKKDSDAGITNSTIKDYRFDPKGRPKRIVGFNEQEYLRKKKRLREKRAEIKAAERWIAAIEDDVTREVFNMRYLQGWSWAKISQAIGYQGNEDYPRKMIHDKHLKSLGVK